MRFAIVLGERVKPIAVSKPNRAEMMLVTVNDHAPAIFLGKPRRCRNATLFRNGMDENENVRKVFNALLERTSVCRCPIDLNESLSTACPNVGVNRRGEMASSNMHLRAVKVVAAVEDGEESF